MLEQAFRPFLEAINQTGNIRHADGEFTNPEELFQAEVLEKVDARHPNVLYALFLYDLRIDKGVAEYLTSGSVGSDSTSSVMAMYERAPRSRRSNAAADLGITLHEENPAVAFARELFPNKPLTLPGILLLKRLAYASDAVYVPLEGDQGAVAARARKLFALLPATIKGQDYPTATFGERVGKALDTAGISYQRSESLTVQDYLRKFLLLLWKHKRDLMAIVPVLGRAVRVTAKDEED
jgi:hypothetical protein